MPSKDHPLKKKAVALVNSKSGERSASGYLISNLKSILGKEAVLDLMEYVKIKVDPTDGFPKQKKEFPPDQNWEMAEPCPSMSELFNKLLGVEDGGTLIIAGGDGTVAWGMQLLEAYLEGTKTTPPRIAIIPMGTGNDLSRTLGMGPGFQVQTTCCCGEADVAKLLLSFQDAYVGDIDRWEVNFFREGKLFESRMMINYFSVGMDAVITYNFDRFRANNPKLCKSRSLNKIWYAYFGFRSLCGQRKLKIIKKLKFNGSSESANRIGIHSLKSLVVANIDNYGAGMDFWKQGGRLGHTHLDDGKLEVCGYFGGFHMGCNQMGFRKSRRLAQTSSVEFTISGNSKVQVDGEPVPVPESGCDVSIKKHSVSARVLTTFARHSKD